MYYICQQSVQHFVHKYLYNRTLSLSLSLWLPPPLHLSHSLSLSPPTTHSVTLTHWFTSTRLQRSAHTMPVNTYTHIQFLSLSDTHASSRGYASFVTPLTYLTRLIHMRQVCRVWMRQIYLNEWMIYLTRLLQDAGLKVWVKYRCMSHVKYAEITSHMNESCHIWMSHDTDRLQDVCLKVQLVDWLDHLAILSLCLTVGCVCVWERECVCVCVCVLICSPVYVDSIARKIQSCTQYIDL